ncbi:MAG: hypothetical protein GEU86_11485 [Actinophytocola sp.]|nr:hypothetical protein [Actinophytocola sp.]
MAPSELKRGRAGKPRPSDVVAAAVLAGMVVAGLQLLGGQLPEPTTPGVTPHGEAGRHAGDGLALATYGSTETYAHVRQFQQVQQLEFLSDAEVAAYDRGGAATARVTVASGLPEGKLIVLAVRLRNHTAATQSAEALDALQADSGMRRFPSRHAVLTTVHDGAGQGARAHYASGRTVVRLHLAAAPGVDAARALVPLLERQLEALPPND